MNLSEFEKLLKQTMGLDSASIGASAVERAVQSRIAACKLKDTGAYWQHLTSTSTELQELIEAVVVPETWFFRDREAFAALARLAYEEWWPSHPRETLRLLSLPCSTGEEPYSMAMALLDGGFPPQRFRIDALDISSRALAHAAGATYGRNSFRGTDLQFKGRYFETAPNGSRVSDAVRQHVFFQRGNLFSQDFLPGNGIYDVIFCRNVLIYFDRPTQDRAIQVLSRLLASKGLLFVGPSETGLLLAHDFLSMKVPLAFAFRKPGALRPAPTKSANARDKKRSAAPEPRTSRVSIPEPRRSRRPRPATAPPRRRPDSPIDIHALHRLADQGHLAEAAQSCEVHLREHGPTAELFHLLGLIRDASGNHGEAEDYYSKALYLDPNHRETLLHLAFLLEKKGDRAAAQLMRQRAGRSEQKHGR